MSRDKSHIDRRIFVAGGASIAALAATGARAQSLPLPKAPVALNVIDVGGALALMQKAFEEYRKAKPELVSRITYVKAPAPELASKIKAQQDAGRVDIDMVLTGSDGLAAGLEQNLWIKLLPTYNDKFPGLEANYEPAALNLHKAQGQGFGVVINYYPSGPLIEYAPERVKDVPKSAEELLAWAKAHPKRFMYARPGQFGPRPHLHDGAALHPRRQGPDGSGQGLGQDLGIPARDQPLHRVLSGRHRRDHEGIRRGIARHHHLDHRLGHQSACPRHRPGKRPDRRRSKASTGSRMRSS